MASNFLNFKQKLQEKWKFDFAEMLCNMERIDRTDEIIPYFHEHSVDNLLIQ